MPRKKLNSSKSNDSSLIDASGSESFLDTSAMSELNTSTSFEASPKRSVKSGAKDRSHSKARHQKQVSGEKESSLPSEAPSSKLFYEETEKLTSSSGFSWILIPLICVLVGCVCLYDNVGITSRLYKKSSLLKDNPFKNELSDLAASFNLSNRVNNSLKATYNEMLRNRRPVVIFITSPDATTAKISRCFFKKLADFFYRVYSSRFQRYEIDSVEKMLIRVKARCDLESGDSLRCVNNNCVELFRSGLNSTGVLWLEGLEMLSETPGLILSLNSLADHKEAEFKTALILLSADTSDKPSDMKAKMYFKKMWTKNGVNCQIGDVTCMTVESFEALWTRIGDFIIDAASFSVQPTFC